MSASGLRPVRAAPPRLVAGAAGVILAASAVVILAASATAQAPPAGAGRSQMAHISARWTQAPIADVLLAFSRFSGRSIVSGANVTGFVTAEIVDTPWDVALETILSGRGLIAVENQYGVIRVSNMANLNANEAVEPIVTRVYRISYARASELQATIAPLLSPRGSVALLESTNSLVVSDIARVQTAVSRLIGG